MYTVLKKFRKLPVGVGGAVDLSIARHSSDPGTIRLGVACHHELCTLSHCRSFNLFKTLIGCRSYSLGEEEKF